MKIACLFDGAGLARLGLEQAGHECTGYELDPWKHHLSTMVGSGNSILADATKVNLSKYDAVWASPPCQTLSCAKTGGTSSNYSKNHLDWSLKIKAPVLWVENVVTYKKHEFWGTLYNAAQFLEIPIQNRRRIIGGRHLAPHVYHPYQKIFPGVCPCITASEYKGCATDKRRASRFYGRKLTIEECAYHQGFTIPDGWYEVPSGFTPAKWKYVLYEAIGNGVPVYMSKAFGEAYKA